MKDASCKVVTHYTTFIGCFTHNIDASAIPFFYHFKNA